VATDRDTEEGLLRLRAVVQANPRSTAFVALAHALSDLGRHEEAEEISLAGLAQHPRLVTGQVALGRALIGRGRMREAQEQLVEAARANPEHGDAFRWLGELVLRRGQPDKARTLLEYAEELLPSDTRVAELLSEAGGSPQTRPSRPRTDFEDTRVGDVRRLAERMHEDPPSAAKTNGHHPGPTEEAITAEFEPQAGKNGSEASKAGQGPAPPPISERSALEVRRHTTLGRAGRIRELWLRGGAPARFGAIAAAVVLLAASAYWLAPRGEGPVARPGESAPGKPLVAAVDMTAAIAAGSLDGLAAVRALGKQLLETPNANPDQLAAAAFASALLASDYGVAGLADALELANAAGKAQPAAPARTALIEASRALAALSGGHLTEAQAAATRAVIAAPESAEALFVSGRVQLRLGKVVEARAALAKAVSRVPVIAAAALDRAAAALDAGEAEAAATEVGGLLARQNDLRAQLILADAERLAGRPPSGKGLKERCREEGRESPIIRTSCAAEAAVNARLAGDRAAAVRAARAATVGGGRNPRALAVGALVLANLGENEAATDALRKIRDDSGPGFVPRAFAQLAVTLGRGETPAATGPLPAATSPDARLAAARLAFAQGGQKALSELLTGYAPAFFEQDPDLAAFALLAKDPPLDPEVLKPFEERADKAGGLAAYVLGRLALAAGDAKAAAPRLQRAIQSSSEACEAARLLMTIDKKARPSALATDAKIASYLRSNNSTCVRGAK
jgi:tetratricopeptide (TPR) repeat protein